MKAGIDIVEISRFKEIKKTDFKNWDRVFSKREWDYCFSKSSGSQKLAGTFACKEAAMKALGEKYVKRFDRIEIRRKKNGEPKVYLEGRLSKGLTVSISHDGEYAVSLAISV